MTIPANHLNFELPNDMGLLHLDIEVSSGFLYAKHHRDGVTSDTIGISYPQAQHLGRWLSENGYGYGEDMEAMTETIDDLQAAAQQHEVELSRAWLRGEGYGKAMSAAEIKRLVEQREEMLRMATLVTPSDAMKQENYRLRQQLANATHRQLNPVYVVDPQTQDENKRLAGINTAVTRELNDERYRLRLARAKAEQQQERIDGMQEKIATFGGILAGKDDEIAALKKSAPKHMVGMSDEQLTQFKAFMQYIRDDDIGALDDVILDAAGRGDEADHYV